MFSRRACTGAGFRKVELPMDLMDDPADLLFFKDEEVGFMNELADREEMLAPASLLAWEADDSRFAGCCKVFR
jgi:hypothetical protein